MEQTKEVSILKAANGYMLQGLNIYTNKTGEPEYYPTFLDAVIGLAANFKESEFVDTIKETQAVSVALEGFFGKILAPKLLAIEAKINPGIENLVDSDEDKKKDLSH